MRQWHKGIVTPELKEGRSLAVFSASSRVIVELLSRSNIQWHYPIVNQLDPVSCVDNAHRNRSITKAKCAWYLRQTRSQHQQHHLTFAPLKIYTQEKRNEKKTNQNQTTACKACWHHSTMWVKNSRLVHSLWNMVEKGTETEGRGGDAYKERGRSEWRLKKLPSLKSRGKGFSFEGELERGLTICL